MAEDTPNANPADNANASADPWFAGFDPEIKGHMQNRGLDKLDPAAAALEAIKAHRAAEKRLGAPADELVRFPKDLNDPAYAEVFKRLGKPDAPTGYDLSSLSPADKPLAPELVSALQAAAHKANMAPGQALAVADAFLKHQAEVATKAETEAKFNAATEADRLKQNWGANFDNNLHVAQRAAARIPGITPEVVAALEKVTGYATTMEALRSIGEAMGEARVIAGNGPGQTGPMSVDQAHARLAEMNADKAWFDKWYSGDGEARREWDQVHRIIVQGRMATR